MKTSFVATVLNERFIIEALLKSILEQTRLPDEIIIVDGGSTDGTLDCLKKFSNKISVYTKKGNRSIGRNYGVAKAKGNIILFSDAGCILSKRWVEEIVKPFHNKNVDVVAGYYKGKPRTHFEQALVPYVLVMPDRVDPATFLPATRSMAIRKRFFDKAGGFNPKLSHNEDYAFARKIRRLGGTIAFAEKAIVYWLPRTTIKESFHMFYRFAYGDAEAGIVRPKVVSIFLRYLVAILLLILSFQFSEAWAILLSGIIIYCIWSAAKNYKYVQGIVAICYLPVLQFVSDAAVIKGTVFGLQKQYLTHR